MPSNAPATLKLQPPGQLSWVLLGTKSREGNSLSLLLLPRWSCSPPAPPCDCLGPAHHCSKSQHLPPCSSAHWVALRPSAVGGQCLRQQKAVRKGREQGWDILGSSHQAQRLILSHATATKSPPTGMHQLSCSWGSVIQKTFTEWHGFQKPGLHLRDMM